MCLLKHFLPQFLMELGQLNGNDGEKVNTSLTGAHGRGNSEILACDVALLHSTYTRVTVTSQCKSTWQINDVGWPRHTQRLLTTDVVSRCQKCNAPKRISMMYAGYMTHTHRTRILRVTFAWHMRQTHAGCARHIRESACTCRARSA
jgi:hypothetical protein